LGRINELQRRFARVSAEITAGKDAGKKAVLKFERNFRQTAVPIRRTSGSRITMKELLEAGVHFVTRRVVESEDEGIYFRRAQRHSHYDLQKTLKMFREASRFVSDMSAQGKAVLLLARSARHRKRSPKRRSAAVRFS